MMRRRINWKALRVTAQIASVLLLSAYFLKLVYPLHVSWRPDLLFQLDPLTHLYLLLSGHGVPQWPWALIALAGVFVFSRIFCGWACPLGTLLDLVSGLRSRVLLINAWRRGSKTRPLTALRPPRQRSILPANTDIYLLAALLVLAALGSPTLWLFDPLVFAFKFLTVAILPVVDQPLRLLADSLDARLYNADWWHPVIDGYRTYFTAYQHPTYADTTAFLVLAALIIGLELYQRRFWCRYICPLGALLRLTYRLHPLRRRVRPDCTFCLKCEQHCHFGGTAEGDCIYCMECIQACEQSQISFLPSPTRPAVAPHTEANATSVVALPVPDNQRIGYRARLAGDLSPQHISRRMLLQYAASGAIAYGVLGLFNGRRELPAVFIRPPGVTDEPRFTELCLKCGQCLKACTTNGLQPSLTEAGISALWTPRLISRLGYCEFNCNLCGQVCPSAAIPNLTLAEKQRQVLGIAFLDRDRCIPFITAHNCTVCEEHCPTADKAIKLRSGAVITADGEVHTTQQPLIDPALCIGCGICENVCPLPGLAAVRVLRTPPGAAFASSYSVPMPGSAPGATDYGAYIDQ